MFRNRTSSQKPNDQLYAAFKQSYPQLVSEQDAQSSQPPHHPGSTTIAHAPGQHAMDHRHLEDVEASKFHDLSPRAHADQWRFTPSMLDPNSMSFASFANQMPGYYTPTPGGINTVYHNQAAGDLHTPGMALQLGTPLSMPMTEGPLATGPAFDTTGFHPQFFQNPGFQQQSGFPAQQTAFPPSMLIHQDSGYGPLESSPLEGVGPSAEMPQQAGFDPAHRQQVDACRAALPRMNNKFRYHVTLSAPTAMIRHPEEIPITYLNKGQAYTVSIIDSMPLSPSPGPVKYRTVIRISFEDDEQRKRPSGCWQLWKEGRGLAEAHQRGGKLQAVEFVDPHPGAEDDPRRPRIELENTSFDCFAVNWSPPTAATTAECAVAVRFNFLSTDFSHSKGVKGIPVRLCAKTEQISSGTPDSPPVATPEVCYSKVKLFRDHGAERKLSNDVAHVKKTIEKLKQQIAQAESGLKDPNKRKRTASAVGKMGGERPSKMPKHKRTTSVSSQGSGGRPAPEEDLHQKLAAMEDMFTSTRPVSVLYLKGLEGDDPDLFPVALPKDPLTLDTSAGGLQRQNSWERRTGGDNSETGSSPLDSPIASARSMADKSSIRRSSTFRPSQQFSGDWPLSATAPTGDYIPAFSMGPATGEPTRVPKRPHDLEDEGPPEWMEALGVDPSYVPPPERADRPAACVYVRGRESGSALADEYFRAVYLRQRSAADLVHGVAGKCNFNASRVSRTFRVTDAGLHVLVDDELVREIPEGQDMLVECRDGIGGSRVKAEAGSTTDGSTVASATGGAPVELMLFF